MAAVLQCPRTLAVHFKPAVYHSTGSSQVLPEFVKSLDLPNAGAIQFMRNGVVRVTYKEPAQCDAALTGGISFCGAPLRVAPVNARTRLVYVRDLPVEVPNDALQVYLRSFGVVHSCVMQTYPGLPKVSTGTRVVKVALSKDLPSSARVSGFDVRLWYQGQPQACLVTALKTVPLTGCVGVVVSQGTWLGSALSVACLLFPLRLPKFLVILFPASTTPCLMMRTTGITFPPPPLTLGPVLATRRFSVLLRPLF